MNWLLVFALILLLVINVTTGRAREDVNFDETYDVSWGGDHVFYMSQGRDLQLSLDQSSGSGFASKNSYGSGFFHMKIKVPDRNSAGVLTSFYLSSHTGNHDEIDFEFLGNVEGRPISLQTNVSQFFVDNIPIRFFKNNENVGIRYLSQPMQVQGSIYDASSWATDGGLTKINWTFAPFKAHFQGFRIGGCTSDDDKYTINPDCSSPLYWWNAEKFWKMSKKQQREYENVRSKFMTYDYCDDSLRYHAAPPECLVSGY